MNKEKRPKIKCYHCGDPMVLKRDDLDPNTKQGRRRIRELSEDTCRRCFQFMRGYHLKGE